MPQLDRRRVNPSPANIIGQRVKATRLEGGRSQAALAASVQEQLERMYPGIPFHLDQSDISRVEAGKRPVWDYELWAFATALDVSADYLIGRDEPPGSKQGDEVRMDGYAAEPT